MNDLILLLSELPENRPLYKDSGLWQIRTDDMEDVLFQQEVNESFYDFIKRAFDKENKINDMFKSQFIGNYVERHKKKLEGLEYGMDYMNKLSNLEDKAEKLFKKKYENN